MSAFPEALGHRVTGIFDLMGIAEKEIQRAKKKTPARAQAFDECFMRLVPTSNLLSNPDLYRAHVRELLERAAESRSSYNLATSAEVLGCLSELSLKAPLTVRHAALMDQLFRNVTGFVIEGDVIPEPWPYSNRDLLGELSRKFANEVRA